MKPRLDFASIAGSRSYLQHRSQGPLLEMYVGGVVRLGAADVDRGRALERLATAWLPVVCDALLPLRDADHSHIVGRLVWTGRGYAQKMRCELSFSFTPDAQRDAGIGRFGLPRLPDEPPLAPVPLAERRALWTLIDAVVEASSSWLDVRRLVVLREDWITLVPKNPGPWEGYLVPEEFPPFDDRGALSLSPCETNMGVVTRVSLPLASPP